MKWYDDERLYQPRIHSRRIRELHKISERFQLPMTDIIDEALREYVIKEKKNASPEGEAA